MKKQIVCYTAARNAMEMEQKRTENICKQFLDVLDNASNNLYNGKRGGNFEDVKEFIQKRYDEHENSAKDTNVRGKKTQA